MICFPNSKINIGLNIVNKRHDGFHDIETIFYPVGLCDVLEFVKIPGKGKLKSIEFQNSGIKVGKKIENNLCVKAYHMLEKDFELPALSIHLHKIIPIGAGLAGGSSNAAFMIKALNDEFNLNLSVPQMRNYAQRLGSDCSFFIENTPAFAWEKGNKLKPIKINLTGYYLVLIYPCINVNTSEAYAKITPQQPKTSLEELIHYPVKDWANHIFNHFENEIFQKYPEIKTLKTQLYQYGALYTSLSGSGSTVYGIFDKTVNIKEKFENFFVWEEKL